MVAQFRRKTTDNNGFNNNLPPQNLEAEEVILGGILLDPEAMPKVYDLDPNDFYIPAHRDIFKAALALYREGHPTDLMSVTSYLYDMGKLDLVGGQSKLAQLVDRTVSATNIDRYANLVREKAIRRRMISLGNEIAQSGYENHRPLEELMSEVERSTSELTTLPIEKKKDTYLERQCDRIIQQVRDLELSEDTPAVKMIKKHRLAAEFNLSARVLDEIYMSSLASEDFEPAMTLAELREKHGHDDAPEWLHHGLIPSQSVILLHALGGDGKTLLSYYLTSLLAKGESWGDFTPTAKKRRVLVVQVDEPARNLISRAEQLQLGNLEIKFITRWQVDHMSRLVTEIDKFKPDLVMIDSITGASKFSTYTENEVAFARPLLMLRDIGQEKNVSFIVIHHSSKGAEGRGGTARGTSALVNSASEVWRLERINPRDVSNPQRVWTIEKSRSRRPCSYLIELGQDGQWEMLGEWNGQSIKEEGDRPLREEIFNLLKSTPNIYYQHQDLSEILGKNQDSVRKVLFALRNDGLIDYTPGKAGRGGYPNKYCFKVLIECNDIRDGTQLSQISFPDITHTQSDFPNCVQSGTQKIENLDQEKIKNVIPDCTQSRNQGSEPLISVPSVFSHNSQITHITHNEANPESDYLEAEQKEESWDNLYETDRQIFLGWLRMHSPSNPKFQEALKIIPLPILNEILDELDNKTGATARAIEQELRTRESVLK